MQNPNLAPNKREQQLYEKQVAEQKALTVRSLRCIYQCCMAQNYYQRAQLVLEELRKIDYVPYLKAIDLEALSRCIYSVDPESEMVFKVALECAELIVGETYEFKIRKKYQIKLSPVGVREFNEAAPSWTGQRQKSIKEVLYDAMWDMHRGALSKGEEGTNKAIGVLKDGLLLAERNGDKRVMKQFQAELAKYETQEF